MSEETSGSARDEHMKVGLDVEVNLHQLDMTLAQAEAKVRASASKMEQSLKLNVAGQQGQFSAQSGMITSSVIGGAIGSLFSGGQGGGINNYYNAGLSASMGSLVGPSGPIWTGGRKANILTDPIGAGLRPAVPGQFTDRDFAVETTANPLQGLKPEPNQMLETLKSMGNYSNSDIAALVKGTQWGGNVPGKIDPRTGGYANLRDIGRGIGRGIGSAAKWYDNFIRNSAGYLFNTAFRKPFIGPPAPPGMGSGFGNNGFGEFDAAGTGPMAAAAAALFAIPSMNGIYQGAIDVTDFGHGGGGLNLKRTQAQLMDRVEKLPLVKTIMSAGVQAHLWSDPRANLAAREGAAQANIAAMPTYGTQGQIAQIKASYAYDFGKTDWDMMQQGASRESRQALLDAKWGVEQKEIAQLKFQRNMTGQGLQFSAQSSNLRTMGLGMLADINDVRAGYNTALKSAEKDKDNDMVAALKSAQSAQIQAVMFSHLNAPMAMNASEMGGSSRMGGFAGQNDAYLSQIARNTKIKVALIGRN